MIESVAIVAPANIAALKLVARAALRAPWGMPVDDVKALAGLGHAAVADAAVQELIRGTAAEAGDDAVEGVRHIALQLVKGVNGIEANLGDNRTWAVVIGMQKARAQHAERLLQRCLPFLDLPGYVLEPDLVNEIRQTLGIVQPSPV